jgi:hypothetical protein
VEPIARTIECLESTDANVADVFIFWLAIAATLREAFDRPFSETGILPELANKVTAIVNCRYKAFIDNSPSDVYFTGFFLNPRKWAN